MNCRLINFSTLSQQQLPYLILSKYTSRIKVKLIKVIDGDTIRIKKRNNHVETVRFLLIDTPETIHPRIDVQPYGAEAKLFTEFILKKAKHIELERDMSLRDRYGRYLAYVYADGKNVQIELLKRGLAKVKYIYYPNTKYVEQFRVVEENARRRRIGLWK